MMEKKDKNGENPASLRPGICEQVINESLAAALTNIPENRKYIESVDEAQASRIFSKYLQKVLEGKLEAAAEKDGISGQIALTNRLIRLLEKPENTENELDLHPDGLELLALLPEKDALLAAGKSAKDMPRPETSLVFSSLFTGSAHEPPLYGELRKEIASCSRIDFLVSFIKWTGLRLILPDLAEFTKRGGHFRVITTTYIGATDEKAVKEIAGLPNTEIHVSYDADRTRLHAKAYIFYRENGFSTAYVGSSNLSSPAISTGLEWNLKITEKDLPDTMRKIAASFESYWNSDDFCRFHAEDPDDQRHLREALRTAGQGKKNAETAFFFDIRPYPFQQEILDRLRAEREVHHEYRNLVVAATGTGKTVIAAFDYRNFCREHPESPCRLLFVVHRKEILLQAQKTFQEVLKDRNFGSRLVGGEQPGDAAGVDHLFASIQSVNSKQLWEDLPADYYDYIVVDEFHHAAAPTYRKLLSYFTPKILLGLTATPERMDGRNILNYFGGRMAAEIRLPEAIDRQLLCPFQYFGVTDSVDLDGLRWSRGGYRDQDLEQVYVYEKKIAEKRASLVADAVCRYVNSMDEVKGLGFCVSIEHAEFMAEQFNRLGISSLALSEESHDEERQTAKQKLLRGEIRFIFVVDLYNEGVDIPEVNTILFLRPTQSLTVFLQQLGRGLRTAEGKDCLTVLDFIGRANQKYNFEEKFAALLENTRHSVREEIQHGFASLPKGCYIRLERKASSYILENISRSFENKNGWIARIASFTEDSGQELTLGNFLRYYHVSARAFYMKKETFARLSVLAGVRDDYSEPLDADAAKALLRLSSIDSRRWIRFLKNFLESFRKDGNYQRFRTGAEERMLQMFTITVFGAAAPSWEESDVRENFRKLRNSPVFIDELLALLDYAYGTIDFVDDPVDLGFDCPLDLHCTYTRDQLFAALDYRAPGNIREGVKWLPEKKTDVLLVTLNKSEKEYSPSTMYNDYSMNERLFHWQSQSTTSEQSRTGQRYIHHREMGTQVLLFVRENKAVHGAAEPYTFLGKAQYVKHEGSRPMNITWKLEKEIPAKYLKKTNQLAV